MRTIRWARSISYALAFLAIAALTSHAQTTLHGQLLTASANPDGTYTLSTKSSASPVLTSSIEASVNDELLTASTYPQHKITESPFHDDFGTGRKLIIANSGLPNKPTLILTLRLYSDQPFGDLTVEVRNTTDQPITIQSIRPIQTTAVDLNAPASADRVLSDSYSEDRPQLAIHDLGDAPHDVLRAVGTQLIYNRQSHLSLFLGALSTDRLLTVFHLREQGTGSDAKILSYEAAATGTTEIMKEESLRDAPAAEQVSLSLPVAPGASLSSEPLMFAIGNDYHAQFETYAHVIKTLHHARVDAPTPMGWWSWTAYYFGLNQGAAITNANFLADNLKTYGYTFYQIDEGYQYARGEYTTPDAALFPKGLGYIANKVRGDGLTFGVWTAPFEVSDRAWVYQHHKDWLLHNAAGNLIHIGYVTDHNDPLFVLDTTNPGAQEYLRQTYQQLYDWGVRFIKMDFMDDTAVEGAYFRPNTTALEAQRIGLEIIRKTMGEDTVLDKDGSVMLNPVGLVDCGRISQDTGHTFDASRDAASGIAARYYMNRNFFIADPDAFTVSKQTVDDQSWHGGKHPLTLEEAKVSIALAAVAGGMFELGDDLPTLGSSPERLALVNNPDLLNIARNGKSSTPLDLLTYAAPDLQPSIFLLKESPRQSILTIFNWTETAHHRALQLADLGIHNPHLQLTEIFNVKAFTNTPATLTFDQPAHSVRMFKLIDTTLPATPPAFEIHSEKSSHAGETLTLTATAPALTAHWDFGDGTTDTGLRVRHAYTQSGTYTVRVTATSFDTIPATKTSTIKVTGNINTRFVPTEKKRPE